GLAVGCPARVRDAGRALEALGQPLLQLAHPALALLDTQPAALRQCDAGRVIAAVFEPMQALHEDRRRVALADVSDDAAHAGIVSSAVDEPSDLPLGERRRAEAPPGQ